MIKSTSILTAILLSAVICRAQHPVGQFKNYEDVGNPVIKGNTTIDNSKVYLLTGSGKTIWYAADQFQFAYNSVKGDFVATADFEFIGKGTHPHRKIGWMLRASADSDAVHYSAVLHGDGLTVLQWRPSKGAAMRDPQDEVFAKEKNYTRLQLERKGNTIIMRGALKGGALTEIGSAELQNMPATALLGLFISAHDEKVTEQAKVSNVTIK